MNVKKKEENPRTPESEEIFNLNRHLAHQPRGTISISKNAKDGPTPPPPPRPEGTTRFL